MPATQDPGASGRLFPSIVRVNSESDNDEVGNEEVARLPVIANNIGEGELTEKWWMKQRNRFNIRTLKAKQKYSRHRKVSFNHQLPPLQGKSILQNTDHTTNTYSTSDIPEDSSGSNLFRPWKIRHNSIFVPTGYVVRSTDELNQSSTSTILSKPSLCEQSQSETCTSNRGVQLLDFGPIQNNNVVVPVHRASPTRRRPPRLYNKLSNKPPNYEFHGFLNSPEKSNSFFVINGEVESQLAISTTNVRNMPKQINREIAPVAIDDDSTGTEQSPGVKPITFDGSMLGDQQSQVSVDAHKSTISISQQVDVNVPVDDNTTSSQGQRSINMQINITLPAEINAASVKRDIVPQPLKVKQPKPAQQQENAVIVNTAQVDNASLQALIKESRAQIPELAADNKKKKPHKSGIVIKHLIPCAPKQSVDWDNYPDMMINGTKFGEYVYRGLQASAAAVLSRIIDKLYRQLGKGKAKDLAKLLRSLKGDLSNLVDHVELMKLLRDPAVRRLLAKGLDKETAKQFQALLAHMFKNGKLPPGMEGDLFQLFNGNLLDNPELTDELLDALQETNPAQEIALLCSLLNNPDISAEEKEMIKEMLRKKLAGDGSNQKLVATLLEMINNGTIDASMFGDGTMDINEIIEQLKQGKMSDDLVSAVLKMMENGVLNSSLLVDDEADGGMMSKILQALREGNSAILGDDEDGITSKILKALKEGKIDMKTALKAILEAKSNKKGGILDKIMKKISRSARRRHRRDKRRRRRHGSGSSYSDSSDYSSDDDSESWSSSSYYSSYTSEGGTRHERKKKPRRHHRRRRRHSGDEYSSSYSSSYDSDVSEFEFTKSGRHRYARDRRKHRRNRSGRDSKGRSRRSKHKGGAYGDDSDFDPSEMSAMGDIAAALALCKDVSGEAQMEYYKKRREEALREQEAEDEATYWLRLAQERRQAAEKTLEQKMAAERLAREEAEEAKRRYIEEYLDETRLELEKQLERKRLENELARLGMEDNVTRTIREQYRMMEQKFKTEAQRQYIAEQMEKLRKERTDRRIELQYEHHILNEYDDYVAVWEEQELEYIKYYCGEECVARVMKAHAEKMARRARERAARERAIMEALQDELMGTLEMIKTKHTLGYLKEGERLEMMHNSARSYFSYFCFVDWNKDKE